MIIERYLSVILTGTLIDLKHFSLTSGHEHHCPPAHYDYIERAEILAKIINACIGLLHQYQTISEMRRSSTTEVSLRIKHSRQLTTK